MAEFSIPVLDSELVYRTSRSGGAGGQHVNKVETKVELLFNVQGSAVLDQKQKDLISTKLKNRISSGGNLALSCDSKRSQVANKKEVTERFYEFLRRALKKKKRRIATKPSRASKARRLDAKKKLGQKKTERFKNRKGSQD